MKKEIKVFSIVSSVFPLPLIQRGGYSLGILAAALNSIAHFENLWFEESNIIQLLFRNTTVPPLLRKSVGEEKLHCGSSKETDSHKPAYQVYRDYCWNFRI